MYCPRKNALALGAALAAFTHGSQAFADDAAAAQALFDQAKKAMAAHRYAEACPKLEESVRLQEAMGALLNLADCYEREGKLASAWSKFLELSTKARAAGQTVRARIGKERAAALAPKLSNLVIDVAANRPDGLEVRRDGTLVGAAEWGTAIPTDAGNHTIEASAPGRKPWSQSLVVADGAATARVSIPELDRIPEPPKEAPVAAAPPASKPAEAPAPPAEGSQGGNGGRVAAIVAGSVGLAGVATGAVFGALSIANHNDAAKRCPPPGPCSNQGGVDAWHAAYDFGNVANVAFIVGGVGLGVGAVLWLVAGKGDRAPDATALVVGPGSIAWKGAW
ncbi:MAG TPA: hypothetical protein VKU41_05500 [Polyangiaceae bacterium]|nr:hypothetical protein [Polyangiaceae bacterium]